MFHLKKTQLREVFPATQWIFYEIDRFLTSVNYFVLRGGQFLASKARKLFCGQRKKSSVRRNNFCVRRKKSPVRRIKSSGRRMEACRRVGREALDWMESFLPKELRSSADGFFAKWKNICLSFMFFIYYIYKERERQKLYSNFVSNLFKIFIRD